VALIHESAIHEGASRDPRPRVAIAVSHPIQHFCPLYAALAADGRLRLKVFFGSTAGVRPYYDVSFGREIQWSGTLTDGYEYEFLQAADTTDPAKGVDGRGLGARLNEWDPAVVQVYGFHHGISRRALIWAKRHRRKTLMVADSQLLTTRTPLARVRKRLVVPLGLRLVDGFLTMGDSNEDYYSYYGARRECFFRSPCPIDTRLLEDACQQRAARRRRIRAELGIAEEVVMLLTVGKLTPLKRPADVLYALAKLGDRLTQPVVAVFAGEGQQRAPLEALADAIGRDRVRVPGFVNTDTLADYYVAADILVHPSELDAHPLATGEAAYCGLPIIVSDCVGSVGPTDDIRPGENGFAYTARDTAALSAHIERLVNDPALRAQMSERSSAIGRGRTLSASVEGFVRAVEAVVPREASFATS
jgi:glycosyltransferase involved in cell wall biosynthesis